MLIIGHRGAAGLAPENTIDAMAAGVAAGVDMLELDVRLTRDGVPVVAHDNRLLRTHHRNESISHLTYTELQALTSEQPIPSLLAVLDRFFGVVLLNIELKGHGSAEPTYQLLTRSITSPDDWDNVLLSSFSVRELRQFRQLAPQANLALLHRNNPFAFLAYQRKLDFTAVGFHRLYAHPLAIEIARRSNLFTYVYTVNRPGALQQLAERGIDGVVTNYPDKFLAELQRFRG